MDMVVTGKKHCVRCGELKWDNDFYNRDRTCKECRKARVRANRKAKVEYYREYDRKRADNPDRKAARYAAKHKYQKPSKEWRSRNKIKYLAHVQFNNALRDGAVERGNKCARCGDSSVEIEAHHEDYTKPLEVDWLCRPCHGQRHREINETKRAAEKLITTGMWCPNLSELVPEPEAD